MATTENDAIGPTDDDVRETMSVSTGRTEPAFGPSDSSDSISDMPEIGAGADVTDRSGTGERVDVEDSGDAIDADDLRPDKIVSSDEAGLAHTPPSPERNGGME